MLQTLFLQVLNMSFTAGIVILFVLAIRYLLKSQPKVFSYGLWSVVLFRLLCPFSFESVISILPTKANPISPNILYETTPAIDTGLPTLNHVINGALPQATPHASVNPLQIWSWFGSIIWFVGMIALFAYSIASLWRLKRKLAAALPLKDNIYTCRDLETAFVLGVFHPKIYLPSNLSEQEAKYIILHEQIHLKRLDHVVKLLSFFVLCLHWFNPLVWLAFFMSSKDMEMSCDEAVIQRLGSCVKKEYSTSLLTLATGSRIINASPLAFGEGDTKGRIQNILQYQKPTFWVGVIAVAVVVAVVMGLMTNPKENPSGFAGVNAIILEIDKDSPSMTVRGIDQNSVIGDKCIVTWEKDMLFTVATNSEPKQLSLDDFSVGDYVSLSIGEVQETYPTKTTATTIQLQPKGMLNTTYSSKDLWSNRTPYIGNNSAVGKLISLLPVPNSLQYDHFALQTTTRPYRIEVVYHVSTEMLKAYDTVEGREANSFRKNALVLLALVDNADEVRAVLTDGNREVGFINGREWADFVVGGDVRTYAESPEMLQKLLDFSLEPQSISFDEALKKVKEQYPVSAIIEADGDRRMDDESIAYSFRVTIPAAGANEPSALAQSFDMVAVSKHDGLLWRYDSASQRWHKLA